MSKFTREELKEMQINPHILEEVYDEQLELAANRKELAKWEAIVRNREKSIKHCLMQADDIGIKEQISDHKGKLVLKVEYKEQGGKRIRSKLWVVKGDKNEK